MAHTFDTALRIPASPISNSTANPTTTSYTCGAGATVLVVGIVCVGTTARTGGAPTYNGVALTQAAATQITTNGETAVELWYLLAPPTGSAYTLSVPNTNTRSLAFEVSSYKSATGVSALDVADNTGGISSNGSISLTTTVNGDAVVQVFGCGLNTVPISRTHTLLSSNDTGNQTDNYQYALQTTAGSITLGWTHSSDDWSTVAAAFKEVSTTSALATLTDNFDDNSLDSTKWTSYTANSATVAETSQKIVLTPAASTSASESGLNSVNSYTLISSAAVVQAVQVADTTNVFTNFKLKIDSSNYIGIGIGSGNLEFIQDVAGSFSAPYTTTYNASVHKWWRLRESNGQVYADYSADGVTWVNFYHATSPITLSSVQVELSVYENTSTATPGSTQFDNFNILTSGAAIDTLIDTFNDNSIGSALWNTYTANGGTITETNNRLEYHLQALTNGSWAGLYSKAQYNLTGKRIQVQVPTASSGGNSWFDLTLAMEQIPVVDNFFSIGIDFGQNQLQVVSEIGGNDTVLTFVTYDSTVHKYISIRENSGTLYWEYSTDGVTWSTLYSRATFPEIPITNLYVVIDDYEYNATSTPGTHYLDNLNVGIAKMETLKDDFEFGGIDTGKWSTWGSITTNATTNLVLELTSTLAANYGGVLSLLNYDLTGSYAFAQLVDAGNQSITSLEVYPLELSNGSNAISIMINSNTVYARKKISGSYSTVGSTVAYNSTTMKWFRIRESSGTTYWEYATDPTSTWTQIASAANPITVTNLVGGITLGTWQSEGSTTTAKVDNFNVLPNANIFTWKGFNWNKRIHAGAPSNNQSWSDSNITVDGSNYLTLSLTNPTNNAPIGAEIFSVMRGFGYGTYVAVIGTRLDNIPAAVGFGGLFTFDFTAYPDYREIDAHETRNYNGLTNKQILHSHVYNNGGSRQFVVDNMDIPSDIVQTHVMKWEPGKITFDAYLGTGTSGTNYFHTVHTTNIPTPGRERVHFNIWIDTSISGWASATSVSVVIRDFSFISATNFLQFF